MPRCVPDVGFKAFDDEETMMKISDPPKYALGIFAATALFAGCGDGSQTPPYHGVPLTVTPDRRHHEKLAYISNFYSGQTLEFHFPKGQPLGGMIGGTDVQGSCTRTGKRTFWIVNSGSDTVQEYDANGKGPIKTLYGSGTACAVARDSGDLALSDGGVVIFKHAKGSGSKLADGLVEMFFIGYDNKGDLFADGFSSGGSVGFVEMPAGSSTFHTVTLPNSIEFPGGVQWDGTYITVGDQEAHAIYRYAISGSTATLEGTVHLLGASDCAGGDIYDGYYLCADAGNEDAEVYAYPAGGYPLYTWTSSRFDSPSLRSSLRNRKENVL